MLGYECFVGVIISDNELFIREAGEHCQRDIEPVNLGMKLTLQGSFERCDSLFILSLICAFRSSATCYAPRAQAKPAVIGAGSPPALGYPAKIDANGVHRPASPLPTHANQQPTTRTWNTPVTGS